MLDGKKKVWDTDQKIFAQNPKKIQKWEIFVKSPKCSSEQIEVNTESTSQKFPGQIRKKIYVLFFLQKNSLKIILRTRRNQFRQHHFLSKISLSEQRASLLTPYGAYVFLEVLINITFDCFPTHLRLETLHNCCA